MMWIVGLGIARGNRLRISAPSEITVTPKPQYPSRRRGKKGAIPNCRLIGTPGHEIMAANFVPPTAACKRCLTFTGKKISILKAKYHV